MSEIAIPMEHPPQKRPDSCFIPGDAMIALEGLDLAIPGKFRCESRASDIDHSGGGVNVGWGRAGREGCGLASSPRFPASSLLLERDEISDREHLASASIWLSTPKWASIPTLEPMIF